MFRLSIGEVSKRLFSEGECMREIVQSARLSRFFVDLAKLGAVNNHVAEAYGFQDRYQLEDAIFDSFGLTLANLKILLREMT
ncbi:Phenylalanyl-tRNA synthetase beta chain (plasmid) [Cupriavidus necator H850]|nr:Phenylalanyl-tRNA synthetase beta chain [Cupriavidus necator H850]